MVKNIIDELRGLAQHCTCQARDCADPDLSHALEELAVDLVAKASDLERRFDR